MNGAHEARIVTIVNRATTRLREPGPLLAALRAERRDVHVVETSSLDELADVAARLAQRPPEVVVLAGGDGSHMAGVTAIARAWAGRPLPAVALAPGGTAGTVARNWGYRGPTFARLLAQHARAAITTRGTRARPDDASRADQADVRYVTELLDALTSQRAKETTRPSLAIDDGRDTRVGFIFGAGLVSRFFEVYAEEGSQGYAGAATIVARVFAGSLTGGALARRVLTPTPCTIEIDGERAPLDRASLLCASVVRDLGLGLRLLYRAAERDDRFHVVATPLGPAALGPQLPLVLAGRPLLGGRRVDALARELVVRFDGEAGAYVLDGELVHADRATVTPGPVLRVLSPP